LINNVEQTGQTNSVYNLYEWLYNFADIYKYRKTLLNKGIHQNELAQMHKNYVNVKDDHKKVIHNAVSNKTYNQQDVQKFATKLHTTSDAIDSIRNQIQMRGVAPKILGIRFNTVIINLFWSGIASAVVAAITYSIKFK